MGKAKLPQQGPAVQSPEHRSPQTSAITSRWVEELLVLLGELAGLQDQLYSAIINKLSAMRQCDSAAILAAAHQEGEVATKVSGLEEQRRRIVGQLCAALGMNRQIGSRPVTLRLLAQHVDANNGRRLQKMSDNLREKMLKVAEANRVAEIVTQEMMKHFKELFAVLMGTDEAAPTYSFAGAPRADAGPRMLDAVG